MRKTRRGQVLDIEGLRELLDLPAHEVRALIGNNDDADDCPYDLYNPPPRVRRQARLSAVKEAR